MGRSSGRSVTSGPAKRLRTGASGARGGGACNGPGLDPSTEARQVIERLAHSDANAQLKLAQAVWAQNGLQLDPAYVAKLRNDYKAQIANLDFRSPNAPSVVNNWVDKAPHHKITQLVDSFDPRVIGYLVNATYFHALWRTEFSAHGTGDFHNFAGTTVPVPMMQRNENIIILRTPTFSAALLPYKGGRFSALLALPETRLSRTEFANFLSADAWNAALNSFHAATDESLAGTCAGSSAVICHRSLFLIRSATGASSAT